MHFGIWDPSVSGLPGQIGQPNGRWSRSDLIIFIFPDNVLFDIYHTHIAWSIYEDLSLLWSRPSRNLFRDLPDPMKLSQSDMLEQRQWNPNPIPSSMRSLAKKWPNPRTNRVLSFFATISRLTVVRHNCIRWLKEHWRCFLFHAYTLSIPGL